ncbi:MAG: DUF4838 domain-containing protein [Verrucomicrobia bacterium]|nr:DUF4838 domain-containing protein [Verrucomicrobiota bacterium]
MIWQLNFVLTGILIMNVMNLEAAETKLALNGEDGKIRVYSLCAVAAKGFIAEEAALHLREITGKKHATPVLITDRRQAQAPAILLELDPALGREAFSAGCGAGLVHVRGGDERGLYYGVMAFFESLGCRWYAPGNLGAVIPRLKEVRVPADWSAAGKPSLPWRGLHICYSGKKKDGTPLAHYDHETLLWMTRNRMNFKFVHVAEYDHVTPLLTELLLMPLAFGHSYSEWVPPSDYARHPDFFPLVAGQRLKEGQRCLSNPDLRRTLVERMVAYVDQHPQLPIISLAPNDGYAWCQCPACAAMDSETDRQRNELVRRNHLFTQQITRAVCAQRPRAVISTIAYSTYLEPSNDVPREENLAVLVCTSGAVNHALTNPRSPSAKLYRGRLDRWLAKAGQVFWYEYFLSYGGSFPRPYERQMVATIRFLVKKGVVGYQSEVTPGQFAPWQSSIFFMYLLARATYDAELDPETLRAEFCDKFHGPAGPACARYYRINQEAMQRFPGDLSAVYAQTIPQLYTDTDVAALQQAMAEAGQSLPNGKNAFRERLALLQKQADEIALTRREILKAQEEALPIQAMHLDHKPDFKDFDKLAWKQQRQTSNILPYPRPNHFSAAWTDAAIWVCFRLGEPDIPMALKSAGQQEGAGFHGSNVDCFFSPKPETGYYYQLASNIHGRYYSARCRGREFNAGYDLKPDIRIRHLDQRWELLLGLSFEKLEAHKPAVGDHWKLACNREQNSGTPGVLGGWPKGGAWHSLETMGEIVFH